MAIQLNIPGDVANRHAATHVAAANGFFRVHDIRRIEREQTAIRRQADHDHLTAYPDRFVTGLGRGDRTGELERVVDTAIGQVEDLLHMVVVARVHRMGSAQLPSQTQLVVADIHGDDLFRSGQFGPHQAVQTNPAKTNAGDRVTGPDPRRVQNRANPGHHCAAKDGGVGQRQVLVDLHSGAPVYDRIFSKAGNAGLMRDFDAFGIAHPAAAGHQMTLGARRVMGLAQLRATAETVAAQTTGGGELKDDRITHFDVTDTGANLNHLAGALVAQHQRHRARPVTVDDREVGVAEPTAGDLDQQFARLRRIQFDLLDLNGRRDSIGAFRANFAQHGGLHLHRRSSCPSAPGDLGFHATRYGINRGRFVKPSASSLAGEIARAHPSAKTSQGRSR